MLPSDYMGFQLIEDRYMTIPHEDWSRVRSPSRAIRRMRQGHRQNVRHIQVPNPDLVRAGNMLIGHPETLRQLVHKAQEQNRLESATPRTSPQSSTRTDANEPLTADKLVAAIAELPPVRKDIFDFTLPRRLTRDHSDD